MKKNKVILGMILLILGLSCCSKEDVLSLNGEEKQESRVITPLVESQCISVSDFIKLVSTNCQDYELDFLNSLPPNMQVYIYPKGSKNYPALKQNEVKKLLSSIINNSVKTIPIKTEITDEMIKKTSASRVYTEARSITNVPIYAFTSFLFGYMEVHATFNYIYAVDAHYITEALSVICDLDDETYIGEYVLDWSDKGSHITISNDKIGLLYNINGDIILGRAVGQLPIGLVCHEVRGKCGEIVVPYN